MLAWALVAARLLLALVFALSGIAKLADAQRTASTAEALGAPRALAPTVGRLLPWVEIALAMLLLIPPFATWAVLTASTLLGIFTVAVAISVWRDREVDCHCFGDFTRGPVGWRTILRNLSLMAVGGFLLVERESALGPTSWQLIVPASGEGRGLTIAVMALLSVTLAATFLVVQLMRQNARILSRLDALELATKAPVIDQRMDVLQVPSPHGLVVGTAAPTFSLPNLLGQTINLESLLTGGRRIVVVFVDPNCGPCVTLVPQLRRLQQERRHNFKIVVISQGTAKENSDKLGELSSSTVLLQRGREVASDYLVHATPTAVVVDPNGSVSSSSASGVGAIQRLLSDMTAASDRAARNGGSNTVSGMVVQRGDYLPEVRLPNLEGHQLLLSGSRARKAVFLFWNPGCVFCQRMRDDLLAWEKDRPPDSPDLLIVSARTADENRAMGLTSEIVLDHAFEVGSSVGASGTPSAVLIDTEGRPASVVAVGASAIWTLLDTSQGDHGGDESLSANSLLRKRSSTDPNSRTAEPSTAK